MNYVSRLLTSAMLNRREEKKKLEKPRARFYFHSSQVESVSSKKKKKEKNNSTPRGKNLLFKWNRRGAEIHKYKFRLKLNESKKKKGRGQISININFVFRGEIWSSQRMLCDLWFFFFLNPIFHPTKLRFDKGGKFTIPKFFNHLSRYLSLITFEISAQLRH